MNKWLVKFIDDETGSIREMILDSYPLQNVFTNQSASVFVQEIGRYITIPLSKVISISNLYVY